MGRTKTGFQIAGGVAAFVVALFALAALGGALNVTGMFFQRKVFEQSYQRSEGLEQRLATLEASLAEVNARLRGNVDDSVRAELEVQRSAITAQIRATEERMK